MNILLRVIPLLLVLALALSMAGGLLTPAHIRERNSPMIGAHLSDFALPALGGKPGGLFLSVQWKGQVAVVNIFASWCEPCKAENPVLLQLAKQNGVNLFGVAWKDKPQNVAYYLSQAGNPYRAVGVDEIGQTTLTFGITGLPETYVVDKGGFVRWKHAGPLTSADITQLVDQVHSLAAGR